MLYMTLLTQRWSCHRVLSCLIEIVVPSANSPPTTTNCIGLRLLIVYIRGKPVYLEATPPSLSRWTYLVVGQAPALRNMASPIKKRGTHDKSLLYRSH